MIKTQTIKKFSILHVIDSLSVGGAEMLLKNTVNILPQYKHCIVYLNGEAPMKPSFDNNVALEFICLHFNGWSDFMRCVFQLRSVIRRVRPDLVHSHLFVASLVARLAVPANIPLINTIHSIFSIDAFRKNKKSLWAERLTLKERHILVAVSKYVLHDYLQYVPFRGKSFVLYNFLPEYSTMETAPEHSTASLRCLLVGNLKEAKNYFYLLKVAEQVKDQNIVFDIYGEGQLGSELQKEINGKELKVRLCGKSADIRNLFPLYDLFIQTSEHEGFGLSVIEAMAERLPVFVSDIQVFREITGGFAHFFPLDNVQGVAGKLTALYNDPALRNEHVENAICFVDNNYSQKVYLQNLLSIYSAATNGKGSKFLQ